MQSQTLIRNNEKNPIALPVKRRTPFVSAQNLHPKYQVQNTKIKKIDRTFLLPICQHKKMRQTLLVLLLCICKSFQRTNLLKRNRMAAFLESECKGITKNNTNQMFEEENFDENKIFKLLNKWNEFTPYII